MRCALCLVVLVTLVGCGSPTTPPDPDDAGGFDSGMSSDVGLDAPGDVGIDALADVGVDASEIECPDCVCAADYATPVPACEVCELTRHQSCEVCDREPLDCSILGYQSGAEAPCATCGAWDVTACRIECDEGVTCLDMPTSAINVARVATARGNGRIAMAWIRGSATAFTAVVQFAVYSERSELLSLRCIETVGDVEGLGVTPVADGWLLTLYPFGLVPTTTRVLSLEGDERRRLGHIGGGSASNPTGNALALGPGQARFLSPNGDPGPFFEFLPWDARARAVWTGHDFLVVADRRAPDTPEDGALFIIRISTSGLVSPPVPLGANVPLRDANVLALWSPEGEGAVVWTEGSGLERRLHYIRLREDATVIGPRIDVRPEPFRNGPVVGVMHGLRIFLVGGSIGSGPLATITIEEDESIHQAPLTPGSRFFAPVSLQATDLGWWLARIEVDFPHRLGIVTAPW